MNLDRLTEIVGAESVITDPDRVDSYTTDWTRRFAGHSPAVVTPSSTDQVVELLDYCSGAGLSVVPQGGNTGLVGGGVPVDGEIVVSMRAMSDIELVDGDSGQVVAQAGATLAAVQGAAAAAGWSYGVDLGARDSATVGGTIATNAGGLHVIRYGDTRRQLLGIEAVTGAGEVVGDLRGLVKDNTGYHLPSLLCGSEGTLAIVTRARLALVPPAADVAVALAGFDSVTDTVEAIAVLRRELSDLRGLELFFEPGLALVCRELGLARPLPAQHRVYLLVETAGSPGALDRLASGPLSTLVDPEAVAMADDSTRRRALWRYREAHTEAIARLGVAHKLDVTLPLGSLALFVEEVSRLVSTAAPQAVLHLFGHAGDGNIHVNIVGPDAGDDSADAAVLGLVAALGGSISAEHGIGRAKAAHLHLNRTPDELALYRRLKRAFDPAGILNPAVLLPPS